MPGTNTAFHYSININLNNNNLCPPYPECLDLTIYIPSNNLSPGYNIPYVENQEPINCDTTNYVMLWGNWYSISNTIELNLRNSCLTGEIPKKLFSLTNLTTLELDYNDLSGNIPTEIGNLLYLNTFK